MHVVYINQPVWRNILLHRDNNRVVVSTRVLTANDDNDQYAAMTSNDSPMLLTTPMARHGGIVTLASRRSRRHILTDNISPG